MKNIFSRTMLVAFAAFTCFAGLLTPAHADSLPPILYASQHGFAHQCSPIGDDTVTEGVICADIVTFPNGEGPGYLAYAQVEAICQNMSSGTAVQCAHASTAFGLYGPGTNWPLNTETITQCGHLSGPCAGPGQRNYWQSPAISYTENLNQCSGNVNLETQVQSVVFSADFFTYIELPGSGKKVYLDPSNGNDSPNQVSGHYFICP